MAHRKESFRNEWGGGRRQKEAKVLGSFLSTAQSHSRESALHCVRAAEQTQEQQHSHSGGEVFMQITHSDPRKHKTLRKKKK